MVIVNKTQIPKKINITDKVYYKTEVGTWRFREALKKLMHNNANATFIVICLIF